MAIAVPKMSGDEENAKVEFDLYIVESERSDQARGSNPGFNGG